MNPTAKTLLLGLGGFGGNILEYLQKNADSFVLPNNYNILIFSQENGIKEEKVPDFSTLFEEYQRIIIFAGIGGTYPSTILQMILKQEKLEIEKFYIVVVAPFSFEGRARALNAESTISMLIESKIGCGIFANSEVLDMVKAKNLNKAFEDFNKKILESIPW